MANTEYTALPDRTLMNFAWRMHRIPRRPLRCDLTGEVRAVVDQAHAKNIFAKAAPGATTQAIYDALAVLQDRLDETINDAGRMAGYLAR